MRRVAIARFPPILKASPDSEFTTENAEGTEK
jgi:hypothetical protein